MESESLNSNDIKNILIKIRDLMIENEKYLFKLDSIMGDGDLGITMRKGFNKIVENILEMNENMVGKILMKAGFTISSTVPATMGVLVGSGLIKAGKIVIEKSEINLADLAKMMDSFVLGIMQRGKSKPGEKTIIDSLYPVTESLKLAIKNKISLKDSFSIAYKSAVEGLESTKKMTSVHGRALYHKERAVGIEDPGAAVGMLLIKGFNEYLKSR